MSNRNSITVPVSTLVFTLLVAVAPLAADDCKFEDDRTATVDLEGATTIRIIAEAGLLKVAGRAGSEQIVADGTACASHEDLLPDVELRTSRRGDTIIVESRTPDSWHGNNYARLDLEVEVPDGIMIDIEDGSGSLEVRDVGALRLDDGSGSLRVVRVAGDVEVNDGSGSIIIEDVGGPIRVRDGSGSIEIEGVKNDVEIREDGSGSMTISDVEGSVRIHEDGSGSIFVADVTGDFALDRDGSGSVQIDNVQGKVRIP